MASEKKILFLVLLFSFLNKGYSQTFYVLDTIESNGKKMVIFSDNSYQYLDDIDSTMNIKSITDVYSKSMLDTNKLFAQHWNNNSCHVRYKNLYFMTDTLTIDLTEKSKKITSPFKGRITSNFGKRWGKFHKGTDIKLKIGDKVICPFGGKVRYARFNSGGYGNLVIVRHYNGLETYYGHLSSINVKPNQFVSTGDVIGLGGNTGHSTGAHLHFEVRFMGNAINPKELFDFKNHRLKSNFLTIQSGLFNYQKNGVKEDIQENELIFKESNDSKKEKIINEHKKGRRKKNPNAHYGNM